MIYTLLLALCIFCPIASYWQFRSVLHPHFIFTISWLFLLPAGVLVAPTPPGYIGAEAISAEELFPNQLLIVFFLFILFLLTMLRSYDFASTYRSNDYLKSLRMSKQNANVLAVITLGIFALELGIQLYASNWLVQLWLSDSLGARGMRGWSTGAVGGDKFIYTFVSELFAACPLLFPLALGSAKGLARIVTICVFPVFLFMLVFDGSRTPFAVTLLICMLVWHTFAPSRIARVVGHLTLMGLLIAISAVMVSNRSVGYMHSIANKQLSNIKYSQDDNYFQLLHVIQVSDNKSADNWDVAYFSAAILFNPVPRYFWTDKPLLTPEFYGGWKRSWETVSFAGELVAMFGKWVGMVGALFVGLCYYQLLLWSYKRISCEFGLVLYLGMGFYVYMAQRSMHNLGMYLVFTVFLVIIFALFQSKKLFSSRAPTKRQRFSNNIHSPHIQRGNLPS